MNTFLWTIVVAAAINTVVVLWAGITGNLAPITPGARAFDAIWTFGMGAWALWLLKS